MYTTRPLRTLTRKFSSIGQPLSANKIYVCIPQVVLGCTTHTVCPAGFPITAVQEEAQESPAPVAEEPKVSGTPKSEPAAKHDDSNVIINMTPDLLTMMIKTAVNESVNAVWQKFMENREILMNT